MLNIFYQEPDPDRWFPFDRYPRKLIRRIVRGKARPGGVMMIALQLMKGLDKLGISYRYNDYNFIKKNPHEIACIIGKPHLLEKHKWNNPILFGAGIYSHPSEQPQLLQKHPSIQKILVPGSWMQHMFEPFYGAKVSSWPAGIDTDYWLPETKSNEFDFLIYNKILWDKETKIQTLLKPVIETLQRQNLTYQVIDYGSYSHGILRTKLKQSKAVIYFCEHETQGMAYQQILATDTPILAWDKGGYWEDPTYYPHKVQYKPVSSVPYWDNCCGLKFKTVTEFPVQLDLFLKFSKEKKFTPRSYITGNLSLEICVRKYLEIYHQVQQGLVRNL